jgi:hypothetical protein
MHKSRWSQRFDYIIFLKILNEPFFNVIIKFLNETLNILALNWLSQPDNFFFVRADWVNHWVT